MASRRNILFRYSTEYAIYEGFLENVTKINVFIGPKIMASVIKQLPIS